MRSDSESVSVGGLDNIDISVFDDFDYTALGHIHRPQSLSEKDAILRFTAEIFILGGKI